MKFIFSYVCFFLPFFMQASPEQKPYYIHAFYMDLVKEQAQIEYENLQMEKLKKIPSLSFFAQKNQKQKEEDLYYIDLLEKQLNQMANAYRTQQEFKEGGHPNPLKQIKGNENLPIYGSMKAENHSQVVSCLASGAYEIKQSSERLLPPVQGMISAGTWQYPQGGLHLGADFAVPLKSEVRAPANGIILYADACVETNNGYLGNWCGWPLGAGNSICMICAVQDSLYIVSMAHLSDEILVTAGQQVQQGDLIALSGNSGNTSGPHTHVEVFTCSQDLNTLIAYFIDTSDFSFQNGWDTPQTCSQYACRIRPESVF